MDCDLPVSSYGLKRRRAVSSMPCVEPAMGASPQPICALAAELRDMALLGGFVPQAHGINDLTIEHFCSRKKASVEHRIRSGRGMLLFPLVEPLVIVSPGSRSTCPVGAAVLISRTGTAGILHKADSLGLAIELPIDRLNAEISAALGEAYKLGSLTIILDELDEVPTLGLALKALLRAAQNAPSPLKKETRVCSASLFYHALAQLVVGRAKDKAVLRVRSVSDAMSIIQRDPARALETEQLAALVGVTAQTLRKGFRASLGLSVKEYIQSVRLERAHASLSSGRDSRTISEVANAAGFAGAPAFTRAYVKHFGETPSRTRADAVREAEC
ncbi:AraC family transcriptional regulator [Altererythrobacter sp. N1]|nr:AraC family transcriptional regulator [Altererythrobacter sp. N1]